MKKIFFVLLVIIILPILCNAEVSYDVDNKVAIYNDYIYYIKNNSDLYKISITSVNNNSALDEQFVASNVKSISASEHLGMLKNDGTLWICGKNDCGQIGDGTAEDKKDFVKVSEDVLSFSCGEMHTAIVKRDGSLLVCGYNSSGQLGTGEQNKKSYILSPIKIMDNVRFVSCGLVNTCIITNDNNLYICGQNNYGQLGTGYENIDKNEYTPTMVMSNVKYADCNDCLTAVVTIDGELYMCGSNTYLFSKNNSCIKPGVFTKMALSVKRAVSSSNNICAIKNDGSLWMCGNYSDDNNCLGDYIDGNSLMMSKEINMTAKDVICYNNSAYILETNDSVRVYNKNILIDMRNTINKMVNDKLNIGEQKITRAQMAHISAVLKDNDMCEKNIDNINSGNMFIDVSENTPFYRDILYLKQCGYVSGYGNGLFCPYEYITYDEALKMLVGVMGYSDYAQKYGGFPLGYNDTAKYMGLTDFYFGNTELSKDVAVKLIENALIAPIANGGGFEADNNILNGQNGTVFTSLLLILSHN